MVEINTPLEIEVDSTMPANIEKLVSMIIEIRNSSKGQYYDNVKVSAEKEGWNEEKLNSIIEEAIASNRIRQVHTNQKVGFRILKNQSGVTITDDSVDIALQTDSEIVEIAENNENCGNDLSCFNVKEYVQSEFRNFNEQNIVEISKLKGEFGNFKKDVENKLLDIQSHIISQAELNQPNFQQPNFQQLYLESQERNIKRLERIVELQNNIILASIQKPTLPPHQPAATNIIHTNQPSHASNAPIVTPATTTYETPLINDSIATTTAPVIPRATETTPSAEHALSSTATPFVPRSTDHANKLRIAMIGDSMLGGLQAKHHLLKPSGGLISNHFLDVVSHGGKTTEDMVDYVKPVLRRAPNKLIVMTGTNDFRTGIDTLSHAKKLIDSVKATSSTTKLALPEICMRRNK